MKLRNRKTGEIVEFRYLQSDYVAPLVLTTYKNDKPEMYSYNSLAELNAEWEDAPEEPEEYWYIDYDGGILCGESDNSSAEKMMINMGNHFESLEEAELAVRKLKAWKRLKDRNLRFNLNYSTGGATINHKDVILCRIEAYFDDKWEEDNMKAEEDLDLLLGGEE